VPLLVVETLAANLVFVVVALAIGERVVRLLGGERGRAGFALLVGLGVVAYVGVLLGLAHLFGRIELAVAAVVLVAAGDLRPYLRLPRFSWHAVLPLALFAAQWLAALAPPEAYDELAYHLPEARSIVHAHALPLTLNHDHVYGNLPALMETLYAEALAFRGTALVHAVHLTVFGAFLLVVAGAVRMLFGSRAAALAVIGLLLFQDLTYNATTAYVDTAQLSFALAGLLAIVLFAAFDRAGDAAAAALLLGFALSVKYSALPTAAFVAVVAAVLLVRRGRLALAPALAGLTVLACGFWYGKNLVRFGNPVYPLYFGHSGVDEGSYKHFLADVQQFGPRTAYGFVTAPSRYANLGALVAFVSAYVAPLALLVRRFRIEAGILLAYALWYFVYWYWLGTHQLRFLAPAASVAIILSAVALTRRATLVAAVLVAIVAVGVAEARLRSFATAQARPAAEAAVGAPKSGYALGLESRRAFLRHYFGCEYDAVAWLEQRRANGAVVIAEGSLAPWFARRNVFRPLVTSASTRAGVEHDLRAQGFRWIFTPAGTGHLSSDPVADALLARAPPAWSEDGCALARAP